MLSSGRLAAAIRLLAAVAAAVALGACGGSESESAADTQARRGQEVVTTFPPTDIPGNGENGGEDGDDGGDPCDEVPCKAQGRVYDSGGRIVLCEQLEVVQIQVLAPQEQPPAVESGPDADEPVEEEEATVAEVRRPQCAPGTRELTVEGLDFDALAGVETSEDGLAAWTPTPIELRGRIVDGTFVVDG